MQLQSLGQEDPLEEEMATHSSILAWRIPVTEEPGGLQSMGSQRVGHDWVCACTHTDTHVKYNSATSPTPTGWIFPLHFYTSSSDNPPHPSDLLLGSSSSQTHLQRGRKAPLTHTCVPPHLIQVSCQRLVCTHTYSTLGSRRHWPPGNWFQRQLRPQTGGGGHRGPSTTSPAHTWLSHTCQQESVFHINAYHQNMPEFWPIHAYSVAKSCPTLCNPMDCSPPGSSVPGTLLARILECVAIPSSRRDLPNPGIKIATPVFPALQVDSLPTEPPGRPLSNFQFERQICILFWILPSFSKNNFKTVLKQNDINSFKVKSQHSKLNYVLCESHSVVTDSLWISRQEYWSGHSLLQGIFLIQGLNPGLLHCRQILYPLSHQASSIMFYSKIKIIKSNPPKRVPWEIHKM